MGRKQNVVGFAEQIQGQIDELEARRTGPEMAGKAHKEERVQLWNEIDQLKKVTD
jgi:hypothetical protein